jgi:hypothetical protein
MIDSIFNSAFSNVSPEIRSRYSISDADLCGMVSPEFYKGLNNPEILGPKSMLHSLEKEQGIITSDGETPEELATREAEEKEQRILGHIARVETELKLEGCAE